VAAQPGDEIEPSLGRYDELDDDQIRAFRQRAREAFVRISGSTDPMPVSLQAVRAQLEHVLVRLDDQDTERFQGDVAGAAALRDAAVVSRKGGHPGFASNIAAAQRDAGPDRRWDARAQWPARYG
jgi:hypothetical protein